MLLRATRHLHPPQPAVLPADPDSGSDSGSDSDPVAPLSAAELLEILRRRWQASYDVQLISRRGRLYLQVMWAYLEQQSFPLDAEGYMAKLEELVATLNGLGVTQQVRAWLTSTGDKPRLGKAMTLPLELPEGRASEFLL